MCRALRQTGWLLAVLGALGLTGRAVGQVNPPPEDGRSPVIQPFRGRAETPERNEQAFLEEIRVELAWLGDPVTFSYGLLAHCDGKVLEVHGTIPNEQVRQHALQLARVQTTLPLVDALHTHPYHLALRSATETPQDLEHSAQVLLEDSGLVEPETEIRADAKGAIIVSGSISSYETKLAVSRALHQLGGCTCAVNRLIVKSTERNGLAYAQVVEEARRLRSSNSGTRTEVENPARPTVAVDLRRTANAEPQVATVEASPEQAPPTPVPARTVQLEPVPAIVSPAPSGPLPPAVAPTPIPHQEIVETISDQPYVTMGIVTFPDGDPAPPLPASDPVASDLTSAVSCVLLQQRVALVCGAAARDVRVLPEGNDGLVIQLTLNDSVAGERLSHQILGMPELGPFHVSLQVHSGQ